MANSPARAVLDVGSVIADTYIIEALVGRGGMGSVFLASHKRLPGKQVAIKLLHAEVFDDDVFARFRREAEIASDLGHPNIVTVHDFNVTPDGTPYLVLEYLRGESLAQRLRAGPLPMDQILSIARQVGSALAAAHRKGIVHRDLKPQNIFLVPSEVDGHMAEIAKVLDFGISKIRGSETVKTLESTLLGTPQYMAPEQARGEHANCDERTDVFAFGAIVYEMLCGHPAFQGASIPEVVFKVVYEQPRPIAEAAPGVSPQIVAAVAQAMTKSVDERFRNVAAFVEALTGQPLAPSRTSNQVAVDPRAPSSAGSARVPVPSIGREAFARTMGPADPVPLNPHAATIASHNAPVPTASSPPSVIPVPSIAQPADAHALTAHALIAHTHDAPVQSSLTVETHPVAVAPPRRSRGLLVGVAITGVLGVALASFLVLQRNSSAPGVQPAVVEPAGDAARAPEAMQVAIAPDAAVPAPADAISVADAAVVATRSRDAAVTAGNPQPPKRDPAPVLKPIDPDDKIGQNLAQAEAAMASNQLAAAERFANAVINASANPRQLAKAHAIRGAVQCALHNNEERAAIALRNVPLGFPRIRKALLDACHEHNLLESTRR